jgi:hypothetical protein
MNTPTIAPGEEGFRLGLWVSALGTLCCLVLGTPILSVGMPALRMVLLAVALIFPLGAMVAVAKNWLRPALGILAPAYLIVVGPLLAFCTLVVRAASSKLFAAVCAADIVFLVLLMAGARRKGRGLLIAFPVLLVIAHLVGAGGVLLDLYARPEPGFCDALAEQQGVAPPSRKHGRGFAHQALYLPGTEHLGATFKVARDVFLPGMGTQFDNNIAIFSSLDIPAGAAPVTSPISFAEGRMPQFMLYDSRGRLAFTMTSVADGQHAVGIIERPLDQDFKVDHWIHLPNNFEPNAIMEDQGKYIVFALHSEVVKIDPETREIEDHWFRPDPGWLDGRVVLSMQQGDEGRTYLATLGFQVIEHNIRTRENRKVRVPWGGAGGVLHILEGKGQIVVVDMIFHNLIFIDQKKLEIRRVHGLHFGPRAVEWDPKRELLFVGDYIAGLVHAFRFSDMSEVGAPVRVGGNLRSFAYQPETGTLLASSKCGLVGVNVDAAFVNSTP